MAAYWTLLQVLQEVSGRVGNVFPYPTTIANPDPVTKTLINVANEVLRDMIRTKTSPMMNGTTVVATRAPHDGTGDGELDGAGATANTITGNGSTWATSTESDYLHIGDLITVTDSSEDSFYAPLRIASVTNDTTAVLDSWPFATMSAGTDADISIFRDRYPLPADFGEFIDIYIAGQGIVSQKVNFLSPTAMDHQKSAMQSSPYTTGVPRYATLREIGKYGPPAGTGLVDRWVMELLPIPDAVYGLNINYQKTLTEVSANTDTIPIPYDDVYTLIEGIQAKWAEINDPENARGAYAAWTSKTLQSWNLFTARNTDEATGFIPANVLRNRPSGSTRYSTRGW